MIFSNAVSIFMFDHRQMKKVKGMMLPHQSSLFTKTLTSLADGKPNGFNLTLFKSGFVM